MAEIVDAFCKVDECDNELKEMNKEFIVKLRAILFGAEKAPEPDAPKTTLSEPSSETPQQLKKRVKKHLSSLHEDLCEESSELAENASLRKSARACNSQLLAIAATMDDEPTLQPGPSATAKPVAVDGPSLREEISIEPQSLMLPPPIPAGTLAATPANTTVSELSFARPQRAAKLKSEKCLKEPKLNQKLRRPSSESNKTVVKVEHEQRASQMYDSSASKENRDHSMIVLSEEDRGDKNKKEPKKRQLRIQVKREKSSLGTEEQPPSQEAPPDATTVQPPSLQVPLPKPLKIDHASDESTVLSATVSTSTAPGKKTRKKKDVTVPKPIKVERFSDIAVGPSPVSSRTRKGSIERGQQQRPVSIYEDAVDAVPILAAATLDAVDTPPTRTSPVPPDVAALAEICNQTVTVSDGGSGHAAPDATMVLDGGPSAAAMKHGADPGQTTFVVTQQNPNATVTLGEQPASALDGDATFNVPLNGDDDARISSFVSTKTSMETARDSVQPRDDSLLTEDESFKIGDPAPNLQPTKPPLLAKPTITKPTLVPLPLSAKAYRMPTRTNELFNPLVQSPVKKKVEAFENAVNAASGKQTSRLVRPKPTKEASLLTPNAFGGKDLAPSLGRFLTPTQMTNITPNSMSKKTTCSASKAMVYPKVNAASNLKSTNSASAKNLLRENSVEEFRKGILEERKRLREQKHMLAAQQREAKERERAERMAKAAKEREEKRIKKQQEAEQKKREMEEINRKLRHHEEIESAAAAAAEAVKSKAGKTKTATDQERDMLMQMKQQQQGARSKMPPPAPKLQSKYTFEMLHEDDSTDDEGKISYKRPQPPSWSLSAVRGDTIRMQQYWPTDIIDSFFSVQPMTPDLRKIFPNIDARHLKRNSSAVWSTPPRYSELPKY